MLRETRADRRLQPRPADTRPRAADLIATPESAAFDAKRSVDVLGLQFESAFVAFESTFAKTYPLCYPQCESAFALVRILFPYETPCFYPHSGGESGIRTHGT